MAEKTVFICIRIKSSEYDAFKEWCSNKGLKITQATKYFIQRSIDDNKLPFSKEELYLLRGYDSNGTDAARVSIGMLDPEEKEKFSKLCENNMVSVAGAIKLFFRKCVTNNAFPFED